jgi:hypothetical protein
MRTLEYQRGAENMSKTTSQRAKIKAALKAHGLSTSKKRAW